MFLTAAPRFMMSGATRETWPGNLQKPPGIVNRAPSARLFCRGANGLRLLRRAGFGINLKKMAAPAVWRDRNKQSQ
jgi:hypothetical protein